MAPEAGAVEAAIRLDLETWVVESRRPPPSRAGGAVDDSAIRARVERARSGDAEAQG